jgi:hypothetical protein
MSTLRTLLEEATRGHSRKLPQLEAEDVQWVVNDDGELGVKIGDQLFFLYKGESLAPGGLRDDGSPKLWRNVQKREFGESCHPVAFDRPCDHSEGWYAETDGNEWTAMPTAAGVSPDQIKYPAVRLPSRPISSLE